MVHKTNPKGHYVHGSLSLISIEFVWDAEPEAACYSAFDMPILMKNPVI